MGQTAGSLVGALLEAEGKTIEVHLVGGRGETGVVQEVGKDIVVVKGGNGWTIAIAHIAAFRVK
jgi:hypothetical protein